MGSGAGIRHGLLSIILTSVLQPSLPGWGALTNMSPALVPDRKGGCCPASSSLPLSL